MCRLIFILLFPFIVSGGDLAIGEWKSHQSYRSASYICEDENKIFCVASEGLYIINKNDMSMLQLSKNTGLSDFGIKRIAYSKELDVIVIIYTNCNIDLLTPDGIININDIKRKEILGNKSINNIVVNNNIAYLSCSFGLVLLDLEREEIKDTYQLLINEDYAEVTGCAFKSDSIYISTPNGIYFANKNSTILNDFNNWLVYDTTIFSTENIVSSSEKLLIDNQDDIISISYNDGYFVKTKKDTIYVYNSNLTLLRLVAHELIIDAKYGYVDNEQNLWIADANNGLLKFVDFNYTDSFIPECPISNEVFALECFRNELYLCHGGYTNFGNWNNKNGASIMNQSGFWRNYDYYELNNAKDIVSVAVNNNNIYFSSFYNGISQIENNEFLFRWNASNTDYAIDTIADWRNDKRLSVSGLKIDPNGNLWGLTSSVQHPLFVKTKENVWQSFYIQQQIKYLYTDLIIDRYSQKWCVIGRDGGANEIGLLVYNDNNTVLDSSDDEYKILTTSPGNGNLPSLNILSIAEDLDGEIWVGTDKGIAVFYAPNNVFSSYNFDAEQILIQEGDYGQYLLGEEKITSILIDGANRKWIGTESSGLYLLSSDGLEEIIHFTKENSPLFSNNIIDLAINNNNGELFIGTSKGLLSYRSDATKGQEKISSTKVFPNPVKENYFGPIAINGLSRNARFKITDIHGNLIFEGLSSGGQAIWYGKNKKNERVGTGVYLLFSADDMGKEKVVSKIVVIK